MATSVTNNLNLMQFSIIWTIKISVYVDVENLGVGYIH